MKTSLWSVERVQPYPYYYRVLPVQFLAFLIHVKKAIQKVGIVTEDVPYATGFRQLKSQESAARNKTRVKVSDSLWCCDCITD